MEEDGNKPPVHQLVVFLRYMGMAGIVDLIHIFDTLSILVGVPMMITRDDVAATHSLQNNYYQWSENNKCKAIAQQIQQKHLFPNYVG